MRSIASRTVAVALLTLAAISGLALVLARQSHAAHELDGRDIGNGKSLYAENCASCHGAELEGAANWQIANDNGTLPAPPHDETGHTWHHDNKLLFEYTLNGGAGAMEARGVTNFKSGMPGFEGVLSENEIWDILAYIRSTWPKRVQDIQSARNPPH